MGKSKPAKEVNFGNVKRVSLTDSESDSPPLKKSAVSIAATELYEMNRIRGAQQNYQASPLQTPYTATTPHTGNPLLGGPKNYAQFNDRDDSDIPANYRHERQGSDQLRNKLGLKLDTGAPASAPRLSCTFFGGQQSIPNVGTKIDEPKMSPKGHQFLRKLFPAS